MSFLRPCPACDRHVGSEESACPFCSAALPEAPPPPTRVSTAGLGRAAIMAFGISVAAGAGLSGCITVSPAYGVPPADAGPDSGAVAPAYGLPADAGPDSGPVAPAYGTPAP